jgi:predicted hotdog family 3-hydroxylacyl-ACP dehydratase
MPDQIENLIPHRAPMRFINALTSCEEKVATATACFSPTDYCVVDGKVLETALVECLAQTVAAALGQRQRSGGEPGREVHGMLVAASNFKIISPAVSGKVLHIEVQEKRRLGPILMVSGKISCDGEIIATGDLSLYA